MRKEDVVKKKIKRNNSNRNGYTGDSDNKLSDDNFKTFNREDFLKTQSELFEKTNKIGKPLMGLIKKKEPEMKRDISLQSL